MDASVPDSTGFSGPPPSTPVHQIKLEDPVPAWVKPGDLVLCGPKNTAERILALEALWAAVRDWNADGTGYSPKIAEAVAALRNLEAQ